MLTRRGGIYAARIGDHNGMADMISGKKLLKIGWYMLALPLIALFVSVIVSMVFWGNDAAVNPVTRLFGAALAVSWALSVFPLVIGLIVYLVQKRTIKREGS